MPSVKSYRNRKREIDMLQALLILAQEEIDSLSLKVRLYREYILKTYDGDFLDMIDIATSVEIPKCLKPLDAIKYIGERNGLDRIS